MTCNVESLPRLLHLELRTSVVLAACGSESDEGCHALIKFRPRRPKLWVEWDALRLITIESGLRRGEHAQKF
jgi:hypothetical protein